MLKPGKTHMVFHKVNRFCIHSQSSPNKDYAQPTLPLHNRWVNSGFTLLSAQAGVFPLWSVVPSGKVATWQLVLVAYKIDFTSQRLSQWLSNVARRGSFTTTSPLVFIVLILMVVGSSVSMVYVCSVFT